METPPLTGRVVSSFVIDGSEGVSSGRSFRVSAVESVGRSVVEPLGCVVCEELADEEAVELSEGSEGVALPLLSDGSSLGAELLLSEEDVDSEEEVADVGG